MTVKTEISRFDIHDELTAPDESAPLLKRIQGQSASVAKLIGVLAGAPAALKAYARLRIELRRGKLGRATRERIALAVAEYRGDNYSIAQHTRTARIAGLGLDEIARARGFNSANPRERALLVFLKATLKGTGHPPLYLLEEAREVDWTDEELIEAVAELGLAEFQSLIANAAGLPRDQRDPKVVPVGA